MVSKKKDEKLDKFDFDDDLDFNFDDDFPTDQQNSKKKRSPVIDVFKGTLTGVKNSLKSGSFWQQVARKALPEHYSVLSEAAGDIRRTTRSLYDESVRTLKPELVDIGRKVDRLVPEEQKRLKKLTSKLSKPVSAAQASKSASDYMDSAVAAMQDNIFNRQTEREDGREARDRAEQRIRDKIDKQRFDTSNAIFNGMAEDMSRLSSFTTSVGQDYMKKSLELQYRSYYVQTELLKNQIKYFDLYVKQNEAVIKNTGLPEFVKITNSERFSDMTRSKVIHKLQGTIGAGLGRVKNRVMEHVRNAQMGLGSLSMGLDSAQMGMELQQTFRDMGMETSTAQTLASFAAEFGMDALVQTYGDKLRRYAGRGTKLGGLAATISNAVMNPSALVNRIRGGQRYKNWQNKDSWLARLTDTFLGDFQAPNLSMGVSKGRVAGEITPSIFDRRAHKSLTEVIPGYLARILQETTAIRTGSKDVGPLMMYDWQKEKFASAKTLGTKLTRSVMSYGSVGFHDWAVDRSLDKLVENSTDPDERIRLKGFLTQLAKHQRMDYTEESITNSEEFKKLSRADQKKIAEGLKKFAGSPDGRADLTRLMTENKNSLTSSVNSAREALERMVRDGYGPLLEEKGILIQDEDGAYKLNEQKFMAMLTSGGLSKIRERKPLRDRGIFEVQGHVGDITRLGPIPGPMPGPAPAGGPMPPPPPGAPPVDDAERQRRRQELIDALNNRRRGPAPSSEPSNKILDPLNSIDANIKEILERLKKIETEGLRGAGPGGPGGSRNWWPWGGSGGPGPGDMGPPVPDAGPGQSRVDRGLEAARNLFGRAGGFLYERGRNLGRLGRRLGRRSGLAARRLGRTGARLGQSGLDYIDDHYEQWGDSLADVGRGGLRVGGRLLGAGAALGGELFRGGRNLLGRGIPALFDMTRAVRHGLRTGAQNLVAQAQDLYLPGMQSPIITANLLRNGYYRDGHGKPLFTMDDLKKVSGSIYDATGNVVVTTEQMMHGLFDRDGRNLMESMTNISDLGKRLLSSGVTRMTQFFGAAGGMIANAGSKLFGKDGVARKTWEALKDGFPTLGSKRLYDAVVEIRDILKKRFPDEGSATGGMSAALGGLMGGGDEGGGGPEGPSVSGSHETGSPSGGFSLMGRMGNMAAGLRDTRLGRRTSILARRGMRRLGFGRRTPTPGPGDVGPPRPGPGPGPTPSGGRLTRLLGAGRRLGGGIRGMLMGGLSAAGGLLSRGGDQQQQQQQGHADQGAMGPGDAGPPRPVGSQEAGAGRRRRSILNAGDRAAWNDRDASGRRDGAWQDRLDDMAERDRQRRVSTAGPGADPRYMNGGGIFGAAGGVFKLLTSGIGKVFSLATTMFSGLSKLGSKLPSLFGTAGRLLTSAPGIVGKISRGVGAVGGTIGRILRPIGAPLARLTTSGAGGFLTRMLGRSAIMAGAGALATDGTIGTVLALGSLGLGAVTAALTSPVVLGGLAVAGTAYLGYKLFKYTQRDKLNEFEKIRMRKYGFPAQDKQDINHRILSLEGYLLDGKIGYDRNGKAYLIENKFDFAEVCKIMGVSDKDAKDYMPLAGWFHDRFLEFFLTDVTTLFSINRKLDLTELDKLEPAQKVDYLQRSKFPEGPYNVLEGPTPAYRVLENTAEAVSSMTSVLISQIQKNIKTKSSSVAQLKDDATKAKTEVSADASYKAMISQRAKDNAAKTMAAQQAAIKAFETSQKDRSMSSNKGFTPGVTGDSESRPGGGAGSPLTNSKSSVGNLVLATGKILDGNGAEQYLKLADRGVTLKGANPSMVKNFLGMVQEYGTLTGKSVTVNSGFRSRDAQAALYAKDPRKNAAPGHSLHEYGLAIDIQSADADAMDKLGLMRKYGFTRPVGREPWHIEPAGIGLITGKAKSDANIATMAIEASLYKGGGGYGTLPDALPGKRDQELAMKILKAGSTRMDPASKDKGTDIVSKLTQNTTLAPQASNDGSYQQGVTSLAEALGKTDPVATIVPPTTQASSATTNSKYLPPIPSGDVESTPSTGGSGVHAGRGAGRTVAEGFTGGTHAGRGSTNREQVKNEIATYATQAGMDPKTMQVIAATESSLNPNAKAGTSSASGLFQFIRGTWNEMLQKFGGQYGLSKDASPTDVKASTLLASEYLKGNGAALQSVVAKPSIVDLYLSHFLGVNGAKMFLAAPPLAAAASILPAAARANRAIFYDNGRPRTISEVYQYLSDKLSRVAKNFGIGGTSIPKTPTHTRGQGGAQGRADLSVPERTGPSGQTARLTGTTTTTTSPDQPASVQRGRGAVAPSVLGFTTSSASKPVDRGENIMKELAATGGEALQVQKKSLDTMIEIRDLMKEFVKGNVGRNTSPAANSPVAPPKGRGQRVEDIKPLLDLSR